MDAYRQYLDAQERGANTRPLGNVQEDYKRGIAFKAAEVLSSEKWGETEVGDGNIGARAIKAIQGNVNLIGRFQVSAFSKRSKRIILYRRSSYLTFIMNLRTRNALNESVTYSAGNMIL